MEKRVLDHDTYATHPARLKWQPWVTVRTYPSILRLPAGLIAVGALVAAVTAHWASAVLVLAGVAQAWRSLRYWQELFHFGCLNAAMVVATNPLRIATCANLAYTEDDADAYYVIRVRQEPDAALPDDMRRVGVQLPAACTFYPGGSEHWSDVFPVPLTAGTRSREDIDRIHKEIPIDWWPELHLLFASADSPTQPGLYPVKRSTMESQGAPAEA